MYEWITHTWNTVKGKCYHDCSYCYMKRWGNLKDVRFDENELKTELGDGNFIFVGSSCDMWANDIPDDWIKKTLKHCDKFDNNYLFQTKNPRNIRRILCHNASVCITVESNRYYEDIMRSSPKPVDRFEQMKYIRHPLYVTIEPIMDFDMGEMCSLIKLCEPVQVNIGADSCGNNLPEPSKEKVLDLIKALEEFTVVEKKKNLSRILNNQSNE